MKHHKSIVERIIERLRGKAPDERFAGQPGWLKAEMLDRAATKRRMRERKRIQMK